MSKKAWVHAFLDLSFYCVKLYEKVWLWNVRNSVENLIWMQSVYLARARRSKIMNSVKRIAGKCSKKPYFITEKQAWYFDNVSSYESALNKQQPELSIVSVINTRNKSSELCDHLSDLSSIYVFLFLYQ